MKVLISLTLRLTPRVIELQQRLSKVAKNCSNDANFEGRKSLKRLLVSAAQFNLESNCNVSEKLLIWTWIMDVNYS